MKIYSYHTKQEVINGSLAFPGGDTLMLGKDLAIFIEIFGAKTGKFALKKLPEMKFSFDKFMINGKEKVISADKYYWLEYPRHMEVTYKRPKLIFETRKNLKQHSKALKNGFYCEPLFYEKIK